MRSLWLGLVCSVLILTGQAAASAAAQDIQPEAVPIVPHGGAIYSVAFSPDGSRMLTGSADETAKLWDVGSGRLLRTLDGHGALVTAVAIAPDGNLGVTSGFDRTMKVWDLATGNVLRTLDAKSGAAEFAIAFSPDGARMVSGGGDKKLRLWNVATGEIIRTFTGHANAVQSVVFARKGAAVVSASLDKTIKVWDVNTGQALQTLTGHDQGVLSIAISPDGSRLASGSYDKTVRLWDMATGRQLKSLTGHTREVKSVAFSPDGSLVASGGFEKTIRIWTAAGDPLQAFEGHSYNVFSLAFAPDGAWLVSAGSSYTLGRWNVERSVAMDFGGQSIAIAAIAVSPDGQRLASAGGDSAIKMWNPSKGVLTRLLEGHAGPVNAVAFSVDGKVLISGSADKTARLWDAETGRLTKTLSGHTDRVAAVALTLDGKRAISGGWDKKIIVWDIDSGQAQKTLTDDDLVLAAAVSPNGMLIASAGYGGTIKIWDAASGQLVRKLEGHGGPVYSLAFSPDGNRLISGSFDTTARLWDVATGQTTYVLKGHGKGVLSVAFSRNSEQAVTGSIDQTLRVWSVNTGQLAATLEGHSGRVAAATFLPDGNGIASGGTDSTIRIWKAKDGKLLVTLSSGLEKQWLAYTPAGFFNGSNDGLSMISVVHGFEAYSVTQFYEHLYRPDLIEAALKGDPEGVYANAVFKLSLSKIFASGPAPQIELVQGRTEMAGDTVKVTVRITDAGGGIGPRIVWRVNGKTSGNVEPAELKGIASASPGRAVALTESFRINPAEQNLIEVIAANGAGLVATDAFPIPVDAFGVGSAERPHMFVLAIGVDKYRMPQYRLNYAVKDAKNFAAAMETVGSALFSKVHTVTLLDEEVSEAGIASAIDRIAVEAKPSDVFVLFLSGHGSSISGRYHYYPQSLDFQAGQTVQENAIRQEKWQAWLAKVDAQKTLLILDTCESGAAVGLVRGADTVRQTAMDQLQYATGQNLIAASRDAAREGYKDHGVLTYVLLEALDKQSGGAEDEVKVGRLAEYADWRVPQITLKEWGVNQRPIRKLSGNDFPIGVRRTVLVSGDAAIPREPTHALIRSELLRERPEGDAPGSRELTPGFQVYVVGFVGSWVLVAREGQKIGYLPAEAVARLQ